MSIQTLPIIILGSPGVGKQDLIESFCTAKSVEPGMVVKGKQSH